MLPYTGFGIPLVAFNAVTNLETSSVGTGAPVLATGASTASNKVFNSIKGDGTTTEVTVAPLLTGGDITVACTSNMLDKTTDQTITSVKTVGVGVAGHTIGGLSFANKDGTGFNVDGNTDNIQWDSYQGNELNFYEEYQATITWSGIWAASRTTTALFVRIGKIVVMLCQGTAATTNASSIITASYPSLPFRFRPSNGPFITAKFFVSTVNNNVNTLGTGSYDPALGVGGNGQIIIYNGAEGATFTSGNTGGFNGFTLAYVTSFN